MRGSCEPVRINMVELECPHVERAVKYSPSEREWFLENSSCSDHYDCKYKGKNIWLCLAKDCKYVLCGGVKDDPTFKDHCLAHYLENESHAVYQVLASERLWCCSCQKEVYFNNCDIGKPKGLQNIGNTCYMNAALQALCNIPALRVHFTYDFVPSPADDKKHCLSRNFQRLIEAMCERDGPSYLVPSGVLVGIRNMHPMFRGYHQHDTQEFLRCFMDQLHDELKEQVTSIPRHISSTTLDDVDDDGADDGSSGDNSEMSTSSENQSDNDYETAADSGVEEWDRLSINRKHSLTSPPRNKLPNRSSFRGPNSPSKQKRRPPKYRSIISDIFDGKLQSSVECLTCNKVSERVETFQDLSLPIPSRDHVTMLHQIHKSSSFAHSDISPDRHILSMTMFDDDQGTVSPQSLAMATCSDVYNGRPSWVYWLWEWVKSWFWGPTISLHDCLAAFFSADELKGDNMYSCEKCSKLRNGVKFSTVIELPEVLCIHLKRFRHELAYSSKISSFVSFPITDLDLKPYLNKACKNEVTSYDLSSVICHHGTAGGGHYTCYAINQMTDQWYELDDQCVTPVSAETVANCEGYVLFYRKKNNKIQDIREKVRKLMLVSTAERTLLEFFVSRRWFTRLETFAEPGPIDNSDFLCPHGGVHPSKLNIIDRLTVPLNGQVWDYLYKQFQGGPPCNQLFQCPTCEEERIRMINRMKYEKAQFIALRDENKADESQPLYAIAMPWFRQWESFVQENGEPPGPIDNTPIVVTVNGQKVLKPGSDYAQFPHELWCFFWNAYGGGPELITKIPQRGPSRASFSSGISVERERDRVSMSASKAKSVESLPVNMGGGDWLSPRETRSSRTHSFSGENANMKISATNASHRKQQSLDNMKLQRTIKLENDHCSKENQREELSENKENDYCPAFTPDELDSYVPFESAESRL